MFTSHSIQKRCSPVTITLQGPKKQKTNTQKQYKINITRSSATADALRDAMCQSKSCQLLHNSIGTTCTTNPEQNRNNGIRGLQSTNT